MYTYYEKNGYEGTMLSTYCKHSGSDNELFVSVLYNDIKDNYSVKYCSTSDHHKGLEYSEIGTPCTHE